MKGSRAALAIVAAIVAHACTPGARAPNDLGRDVVPACPRGPLSVDVDAILPRKTKLASVKLIAPNDLDAKSEPGCIVPFRNEPDDRLLDVGRVSVHAGYRLNPALKRQFLGRGRLQLGRRTMRLTLVDAGGDETFFISVDGNRVVLRRKGSPAFTTDVGLASNEQMPLPFDALVTALDGCENDQRLGRTEDARVIEAKREGFALFRTRTVDQNGTIDTSYMCDAGDVRLAWRSGSGDMLPMFTVLSRRSERTLEIARQSPNDPEEEPTGL